VTRRLWLVGVLLAAVCLPAVPAAAQDEFFISGAGNTYAEITVREMFSLRELDVELTGGRQYAGFVIESLDLQPTQAFLFAALIIPTVNDGAPAIVLTKIQARPGRYRVRLLADAATASAVLHITGPGHVVHPKKRLRTTVRAGALALAPGTTDASARLSRAVPAGSAALISAQSRGTAYEDVYACATNADGCSRMIAASPSPLPNVDPGFQPAAGGPTLDRVRPEKEMRSVVFGAKGARADPGGVDAFSIAYAP
jgi:hypothetical protein